MSSSPTDAASQEPVVGSAQRVVVARARAPRVGLGALKSYFSTPKRENLSFFFSAPPRYFMVFGGQTTFSTPQIFFFRPPNFFSAPKNCLRPHIFFRPLFATNHHAARHYIWAPALGPQPIHRDGALTSACRHINVMLFWSSCAFHQYLSACVSHVSLLTHYTYLMTVNKQSKKKSAVTNRRIFFFRRSEKPPFFGAQNQKSAFSAGALGAKAYYPRDAAVQHCLEYLGS